MRKGILSLVFILLVLLSACDIEREVTLSDLEGKTEEEIREILEDEGLEVNFLVRQNIELERSNQFVEYGRHRQAGDTVESGSYITVHVSATLDADVVYFEPVDIPYDGPHLDEEYFDRDYYTFDYTFDEEAGNYIGGGGAFSVTYEDGRWVEGEGGCIDGDTTVFTYPPEVYGRIESHTPSTRYLNLDTPEIWPPDGREEWGRPATNYVCELLAEAEEIVLQTDPGDNLLGRYGRLLAWVWLRMPEADEFKLLNYKIVRQGLGVVAYEFGAGETDVTVYDDMTYNEWMHYAEAMAKEEERGHAQRRTPGLLVGLRQRRPPPHVGGCVEPTEERLGHIRQRHPDLLPAYWECMVETLEDPDQVRRSVRMDTARLFVRWFENLSGAQHVVVVSDRGTTQRNWIITAYLARKLAGGEVEWKRD